MTKKEPPPPPPSVKILVSACLLGQKVRYDGQDAGFADPRLARWQEEGRLVMLCPETAGGLPIPRPAAELRGGKVIGSDGADYSAAFERGAQQALTLCRAQGISIAILKENSPSCGSNFVYDGSFSGHKIPGEGLTASLLRAEGVAVFSEQQLDAVEALLAAREA